MVDDKEMDEPTATFVASPECVSEALETFKTGRKPDFTVTRAYLSEAWNHEKSKGFEISWETVSAGFGSITVAVDQETGKVRCDTESMSKRFVKEVFAKFVDDLPESTT